MDEKIESFEEVFRKEIKKVNKSYKAVTELINIINSVEDMCLKLAMVGATVGELLEDVDLPDAFKIGTIFQILVSFTHKSMRKREVDTEKVKDRLLSLAKELQREMEKDDKD